jgi:hypothetical protein
VRPIKIAFDLDGVLFDFVSAFEKMARQVLGQDCLPNPYAHTQWDFPLSGPDTDKVWAEIKSNPNFWEYYVSALAGADQLEQAFGHDERMSMIDVYYITARPDAKAGTALYQANAALQYEGLSATNSSVIVVPYPSAKPGIINALNITHSIDDRAKTVRLIKASCGPSHKTFLMDQPYNRADDDLNPIRVETVTEFLTRVMEDL